MTILRAIRDRLTGRNASLPFAGSDRLDDSRVVEGLSDRSPGELEAVEEYEEIPPGVLEVPPGELEAVEEYEEILAVLKEADPATIKRVHDRHQRIGQPNPRAPRPVTSR